MTISILNKILERKTIKYFLLAISIIGFLFCVLLMLPQIQDFIIKIVETKVLQRKLRDTSKWKNYISLLGYSYSCIFVAVLVFFMRKKFITSLCLLTIAFGVYLYMYKMFYISYGTPDKFRFYLYFLFFVTVVHITVNKQYFCQLANKVKIIPHGLLTENKILYSSPFVFICGGLLGTLFFIYIFGTAILDFTYTDWLMSGGDLSQHYLGWKLFRNSAWHFPLGLTDNIVYPFKISIIYTDSIPFFAVIFKLLSPVLPENFQYFGLFGILCYALQGGTGALVVKKIGGNTGQSIIGSMFFTLSTVMIWRLYFHTSLAAHFILLLCILLCLKENLNTKKLILFWSCLFVLSVLIHLYFTPMVMIFMFFQLLRNYFLTKNFKNQCVVICATLLALIGTMFCFGAFYFVKTSDFSFRGWLGMASANLNSFFNPMGMSSFIKDMPLVSAFPHEGFSYLGLGIILFIVFIIYHKIGQINQLKTELFPYILGIVLAFSLFSLSPTITFNQYKLFTYPVPLPFERLWSVFRSTGRMTWPIIYIVMTICIWWAITRFSRKKAAIILSVLLLIQWADLKPWFVSKGNYFKTRVTWRTELSSPAWGNLANDYKHIFFMGDYTKLYSFLDFAANNKMTVNDAYLARTNSQMIKENKQKEITKLANGKSINDTIYVFEDDKEQISLLKQTGMVFFFIDDVFIGINSRKAYLDNYEFYPSENDPTVLFTTGILGQYLAKTYTEVKQRPHYIIREVK
jgi:hypothetical protein